MRFTTQLLAVALAVADLTFAQNYTNATTNATTLALEAELTNLEHFWSYGRSPPVYPSPIGQGNGDWAASYAKAQALVAQMTNEEKNNITYGYTSTSNGCAGNSGAVHRLDFPGLCLQDAGNGVRGTDGVNGYPAGVHVGASWNKNLAYNRAQYMGAEFKAKGVNVLLGPVVGPLGRVAEMGRNWEGFAADPYLTGSLTFETVRGIQESVISCIKHLVAYEQETNRNPSTDGYNASVSSNLDDKSMHELYLWPFQDAVHAGVGSVMCSYNRVNNSYACQNSAVQNGLLKTELGFEGFVVSDWGAQHTGLASAEAGLDMAMPSSVYWQGNLSTAVTNGSLPQTRLDDMATRIVAAWYQYAELEHPGHGMPLNLTLPHELVDARNPASKPTLFQGAVEGHVLVKNTNNALPLKTPRYLSLFGYDAVSPNSNTPSNAALSKWDFGYQGVGQVTDAVLYDVFVDPTSVPSSELPQIAGNGTMWTGGGSGAATPAYIDAPYNAIQRQAMDDGTFLSWDFTSQSPIVERASETCLVFINEFASEGFDRPGLADSDSDELVLNVAAQCNNTMVIIHNAGIRLVDAWIENPNITAVMFAHLPGQDSGKALVEVLYGKQSPSGRLPYTVAKKAADYGSLLSPIRPDATSEYYTQANFTEGVYIDYRAFIAQNITPRFDFGYGLTYTTFDYSSLQTKVLTNVSTSEFPANTSVVEGGIASLWDVIATVDVTVTNTGSVTASEVAQLYVNIPGGPAKVLRGYSKQGVQPGKSVKFDFDLTRRDLSTWDTISQAWQLQSGSYPIYVGKSVLDIQLTGNLHI